MAKVVGSEFGLLLLPLPVETVDSMNATAILYLARSPRASIQLALNGDRTGSSSRLV